MVYRRGFGAYGGRPAVETSWEKQVLALSRACSEFGLTVAEVEAITPARYNACHGNSYAVWNKQQLSDARTAKQAAAERALEEAHGGKEGLAAHRAAQAAVEEKKRAGKRAEICRTQIAELMPGRSAPQALPDFVSTKKDAKALFFLTDADLKKVSNTTSGAELSAAAKKKHGALAFEQKRQAEADQRAANQRAPIERSLREIEERYPEFKVSARVLAERDAAKLEAEATAAEATAAEAARQAAAKRQKADAARTKAVRLAISESGDAGAASSSASSSGAPMAASTPAPAASAAAGKRKADVLDDATPGEAPVSVPLAPIFRK